MEDPVPRPQAPVTPVGGINGSNSSSNANLEDMLLSSPTAAANATVAPLPHGVGVALVKLAARLEPQPDGFEKVPEADQDAVFKAFERLNAIHNHMNDAPEEWYCSEIRSRTPYSQSAVTAYECYALGYKKPIGVGEMLAMRDAHRRFANVYWDPLRTGKNPRLVGALAVRVHTAEYAALVEGGQASMRDAAADPGAVSAVPPAAGSGGTKRRFFGLV